MENKKSDNYLSPSFGRTRKILVGFKNAKLLSLRGGIFLFVFFFICLNFSHAQNSTAQLKDQLNQRLAEVQKRIELYSGQIKQKENEAVSLQREIDILESQIKQTQLEIEQTELAIQKVDLDIGDKEKEIGLFNVEIDRRKESLAEYLRLFYEYDQISLPEIILQTDNFSDFFNEIQSLESVQTKIQSGVNDLKSLRKVIEGQKNILEEERDEQNRLRSLMAIQSITFQNKESQKQNLLSSTKGQEALFKKLREKAYTDVQAIKNQIYSLEGAGLKMTLEEALDYAAYASAKTGVRPAFLLAILKKESSWGTNVGTGSWRSDMHPRDHEAFLSICQELGFDPDKMPVSRKPSYGWGGAMGAAQFLPSVWLSYKNEIASLTGHNPPNPWNIEDAFTASALKLSKNGASAKTNDAEWKAAMIYFAGKRWNSSVYRFYGDSVMELAKVIQEQIDAIGGR